MKKIIAFGKLLDRVRYQGSWSRETFIKVSEKAEVTKSEASRFHDALVHLGYLVPSKDRRKTTPTFDVNVWHNEDAKHTIIRRVLADYPVIQKRGRVKGKVYTKPVTAIAIVPVNPLANISAKDMVAELRSRGFVVSCKKEVIITEEL
jgi:hypothetical protein